MGRAFRRWASIGSVIREGHEIVQRAGELREPRTKDGATLLALWVASGIHGEIGMVVESGEARHAVGRASWLCRMTSFAVQAVR